MGFHTLPSACWSLLSYWLALAYWHQMPAPTEMWFFLLSLILNILPWSLPWSPVVRTLHSLLLFLKPQVSFLSAGSVFKLLQSTHRLQELFRCSATIHTIHWCRKIQRCLHTTLPATFLRHYLRRSILRHPNALSWLGGRIYFLCIGKYLFYPLTFLPIYRFYAINFIIRIYKAALYILK